MAAQDLGRGATAACEVPRKGPDMYVIFVMIQFLRFLGFKRAVMQSDQEPAIKAVVPVDTAAERLRASQR